MIEKGEYVEPESVKCEKPSSDVETTSEYDDPDDSRGLLMIIALLPYCYRKFLSNKHSRR